MGRKATEKFLIGPVSEDIDIARYAVMLQPCFERAQWRWFNGEKHGEFPPATRIAESIRRLSADVSAEKHQRVSSGGLEVRLEDGRKVLYVDGKLKPEVLCAR